MHSSGKMKKAHPRQVIPEGLREEFATVLGHRVRYLAAGSGPPLLLLHGLMGFSFSFSENLRELSRNATVYAPDLLNTGYSDRVDGDATLPGIADQVSEFMNAVGIAKADVLGSSHGGAVAMVLSLRSPERVSRLILVSPANPWSEEERLRVSFFSMRTFRSIGLSLRFLNVAAVKFSLERMYRDPSRIMPGTVEGYSPPVRNRQTLEYFLRAAESWHKDFAELKTTIHALDGMPKLLVWGTHDSVVPLATARTMQEHLPNTKLVTLDTGHLPYEELPGEFTRAVTDFIFRR